jgi:hypothetical protein
MQLSVSWCLSDARQRYDTPRSVEGRRTESGVIDWNGSRPRLVATSAGDVDLRIPQLRKGSFLQAILEHGRSRGENLYASKLSISIDAIRATICPIVGPRMVAPGSL